MIVGDLLSTFNFTCIMAHSALQGMNNPKPTQDVNPEVR